MPPTYIYSYKLLLIFGASLVAQLVKNLPTMQETLGQFLVREDPLEKGGEGKCFLLQHSGLRIPWTI